MPDDRTPAFPAASLEILELPQVLAWIAEHAATSCGRGELEAWRPGDPAAEVRARRQRGREALAALLAGGAPDLVRCPDPAAAAAAARRRVLDGQELRRLAESLEVLAGLRTWAARASDWPVLAACCAAIPALEDLHGEIRRVVDPRGQVRDEAHPALEQLRARLRALSGERSRTLDTLAERWHRRGLLRNRKPVQRGDRLLLAVRSSHQGRAPGILHGRSQSGDTVYIEPSEVVALSNALADARSREERLVHEILSACSRAVAARHEDLGRAARRLGEVDAALASARWCQEVEGAWPEMEEGRPGGVLLLRQARHPLLLRRLGSDAVVPLTLELGATWDLMVVTGPNTGGKTVVLLTVGLLVALAAAGLPVPAAPDSRVPWLPDLGCDIGDPQSLESSLSTFSGHLRRILAVLARARPGTLVLLDELGTGTDPEEGACLGRAILECLLERGCLVLATTHLGALKLLSLELDRAANASMEFDPQTLAPRYRLLVGVPGASHALDVAAGLGLPAPILERARALRPRQGGAEKLLADVSQVRRDAELLREEAREEADKARDAARRMAEAEAEAALLRELRLREAEESLIALQRALERELSAGLAGLSGRLRDAERRALEELAGRLRAQVAACDLGGRWLAFLRRLRKGEVVWVPRYRQRLHVLKVDRRRGRVRLRGGDLEVELPIHELSWVEPPPASR